MASSLFGLYPQVVNLMPIIEAQKYSATRNFKKYANNRGAVILTTASGKQYRRDVEVRIEARD